MAEYLDKDDDVSVNIRVNMWNEEEHSPVLIFKPENSPIKIGPSTDIAADDRFILGFQTKAQMEMMMRTKDDMLFMDGTHGTNEHKYQLFIVLAVDDQHQGYPVASFVISHADSFTITLCLQSLKEKSGYEPRVCILKHV